jgi:hypothetical protein
VTRRSTEGRKCQKCSWADRHVRELCTCWPASTCRGRAAVDPLTLRPVWYVDIHLAKRRCSHLFRPCNAVVCMLHFLNTCMLLCQLMTMCSNSHARGCHAHSAARAALRTAHCCHRYKKTPISSLCVRLMHQIAVACLQARCSWANCHAALVVRCICASNLFIMHAWVACKMSRVRCAVCTTVSSSSRVCSAHDRHRDTACGTRAPRRL